MINLIHSREVMYLGNLREVMIDSIILRGVIVISIKFKGSNY